LSNTIVVYYSFSGNTRLIAEKITKSLNSEKFELIPDKKIDLDLLRDKEFFNSEAKCSKINDISKYKNIIIGSPVWARTISPPVKWFIEKIKDDYKGKVSFFCCHSGVIGDSFEFIEEKFTDRFLTKKGFYNPLTNLSSCFEEVDKWVNEFKTK